jgi:hypothetical protein
MSDMNIAMYVQSWAGGSALRQCSRSEHKYFGTKFGRQMFFGNVNV